MNTQGKKRQFRGVKTTGSTSYYYFHFAKFVNANVNIESKADVTEVGATLAVARPWQIKSKGMTFYESEIKRIRSIVYSNQAQFHTVIGIRNFIDNNFDKELNLDLLSHFRYVSKYHLLRLFKKYYGQTPKQYLTDKRLEKSKEYLKKGMSITETCFAIGFKSPCSFSTLFKTRTGLTPTDFQKEQLSQSRFNTDFETLQH